jgi:hypothetical protein
MGGHIEWAVIPPTENFHQLENQDYGSNGVNVSKPEDHIPSFDTPTTRRGSRIPTFDSVLAETLFLSSSVCGPCGTSGANLGSHVVSRAGVLAVGRAASPAYVRGRVSGCWQDDVDQPATEIS